jgi:outer membrane lipoprotein LolB
VTIRTLARTALVLFALFISACATVPKSHVAVEPEQIDAFQLNGRVNVRVEQAAYPGRIRWQHGRSTDEVWLYSPIGTAVAHMWQDANGARLVTADGKEYRAQDVNVLARQVLGYELPLDGLQYWVRGLPSPSLEINDRQADSNGRPELLRQQGWKIAYLDWKPAGVSGLPSKLDVIGNKMRMRLVVDEWKLVPDAK